MAKEKQPQQVVVATFKAADVADTAAQALKEAQKKKEVAYKAYTVVSHSDDKKLHVKETGDVGGIAGMASGGLLGLVIALMAGPFGWVGAAVLSGGAVGGIATKLIDSGVKNDQIKAVGENLNPGMSAVLVLVNEADVAGIQGKLTAAGGAVETAALAPAVVESAETHATEAAPAEDKKE